MKKRVLALFLSLVLCVSLLPAALADGKTYEEAVAETLRNYDNSPLEVSPIYETELCSVFSYEIGGMPHGPYALLALIYKAGSPLGEGTVINLPIPPSNGWGKTDPPERLELNEDKTNLSYSFYFRSPLYYDSDNSVRRAAGTFLYTVDLATGEVTEAVTPPTYEDILERHFPEYLYAREQVLEAPGTTVLLLRLKTGDAGYSLHLVDRAETSDHRVRDLILPSTVISDDNLAWAPTDRAPDRLSLSEDGKTLTYVYSFPDELISPYYGTTLHEAGTYTYTVDISTGELSVDHTGAEAPLPDQNGKFSDVPAGSWFEKGVTTCAQMGVMVGTGAGLFSPDTELTAAECLTFALRLYDLQRGGDGTLETAPEDWGKLELTLSDGTTFTRYGYSNPFFSETRFTGSDGADVYRLYVQAPGETTEEREAWAKANEGKGAVQAYGVDYPGILTPDSNYYGPLLRFDFDAPGNGGLDVSDLVNTTRPGPDKWFRNAVYTAEAWGLRDKSGFETLARLCYGNAGEAGWCDRGIFAQALSVAAGELEKQYAVERIPDLERNESTAYIYTLYEAGILNGMDSTGVFNADKSLTRAEAAVMVARILDEGQRLTEAPAAPNAYDIAVAELRGGFTYYDKSERTYETEDCTVFVYDRGGAMHTGDGNITIIYKPGSQPGVGAIVEGETLDYATYLSGPDRMDFNAEANTLTYAYRVEEDIIGSEGYPSYPAGIHTFTVDLPTGETTRSYAPFSLEGSVEVLAKGRNYTLEQRLDGKDCAVILRWKPLTWTDDTRDYELWLVKGDGSIQKLLLPSTVLDSVYHYTPTDRAPDSLTLSADGRTLTYTYHFDEALEDYHEAGTYTYTVDLATGELSVELLPPYEAAVADIFQLDSFQLDRRLETSQCSIIAGTYRAAHVPRACVVLVYKPGSLPGPGTRVFLPTQGGVDTSYSSILPDTMDLSQDGTTLTYTYHFNADGYALDKTYMEHLTQAAGTHTYTVDLTTGEYAYAHTEK